MANPIKPYGQRPFDPGWADQSNNWGDWVTSALNQLIGQNGVPPAKGFPSLSVPVVDPTSSQITSAGSRMSSVTTAIAWTATTTTVTFYWDGTNGSQVLRIGRDDGTVYGPNPAGSPVTVTGLTANTQYFFYPYFDETLQAVRFPTVANVAVGSPAVAFTSPNFPAAQQQILRGHVPLGLLLVSTGVTTPNSGSTSGSGGSGGGGAGSGGGRGALQG